MLYLDTSALVKLVVVEDETAALRDCLAANRDAERFGSMLVRAELLRAVAPAGTAAQGAARRLLTGMYLVDVTRELLDAASGLRAATRLRTLDAIHLVTAMVAQDRLTALITYDARMAGAATELGLLVASPPGPGSK